MNPHTKCFWRCRHDVDAADGDAGVGAADDDDAEAVLAADDSANEDAADNDAIGPATADNAANAANPRPAS